MSEQWQVSNLKTVEGESMVVGGEGSEFGLVAVVSDEADAPLIASAPELERELKHLVRLLEPLEQAGSLNVPGLATLNGPRAALAKLHSSERLLFGQEPRGA